MEKDKGDNCFHSDIGNRNYYPNEKEKGFYLDLQRYCGTTVHFVLFDGEKDRNNGFRLDVKCDLSRHYSGHSTNNQEDNGINNRFFLFFEKNHIHNNDRDPSNKKEEFYFCVIHSHSYIYLDVHH